jgi:hypothetical protein
LQDANWWADFPTSAAQASAFWRPEHSRTADAGHDPDGTLAASDAAVARLVGALGPLRLPDIPDPVTPDTLPALIAANVYAGATDDAEGPAVQARKSHFLGQLVGALLAAAADPPPARRAALAAALLQAFERKELLLTVGDPAWAAALRELGWDGHLRQEPGDFVYLVETTVSNTKLGQWMQTELGYAVDLDSSGAIRRSRVELRVHNRFVAPAPPPSGFAARAPGTFGVYPPFYYEQWWNPTARREERHLGRYAGYYRLYVPRGTLLVGADGWDAPLDYVLDETGRAVIGGYLVVDPEETRAVRLELVPPAAADARDGSYRLAIPKQPSAPARDLTVSLLGPAGLLFDGRDATGSGVDAAGQPWLEWRATGDVDRTFAAAVRLPGREAGGP